MFSFLKSETICSSSDKTAMTEIFQRHASAVVLFTYYPVYIMTPRFSADIDHYFFIIFACGCEDLRHFFYTVACKAAPRRASSSTVLIIHIFITLISATSACYTFLDIFWHAF